MFHVCTFIAIGLVASAVTAGSAAEPIDEVHVVVNRTRAPDGAGPSVTKIRVDRPGKRVALVLLSESAAEWLIASTKATSLDQILIEGDESQTTVMSGPPIPVNHGALKFEFPLPKEIDDASLRPLIRALYRRTGAEVVSFQAAAGSALVKDVHKDKRLHSDYPTVVTEGIPKLDFPAVHTIFASRNPRASSSYGRFTLQGPVEESLRPVPQAHFWSITQIARGPDDLYFGIGDRTLARIDFEKKLAVDLKKEGAPSLSWEAGLTYDGKRQRFLVLAGGELHAYATETKKWTKLAPLDAKGVTHRTSLAYSSRLDRLYTLSQDRSEEPELRTMDADGKLLKAEKLDGDLYPGILGDFVPAAQLFAIEEHLVLIAHPTIDGTQVLDETLIYLINPENGKAVLTGKY